MAVYPENIIGKIKDMGVEVTSVDALDLAEQAGTAKAANVVLMGVVSKSCLLKKAYGRRRWSSAFPQSSSSLNKKAFEPGQRSGLT